jgi:hypothetical protein
MQTCPELLVDAVDYLQQEFSPAAVPSLQPPTVLAIDVTADAQDMEALKKALLQVCW